MSPTTINESTNSLVQRQKKAAAQKKFDTFFLKLTVRVNKYFGPIPLFHKETMKDDDFLDDYMIEKDRLLLLNMYGVLNKVDTCIPDPNVKTFAAHKLLKWMIKSRPDVIHDMFRQKKA